MSDASGLDRPRSAGSPRVELSSPISGRTLTADTPHSLAVGSERWPVIEGIPYVRIGRDALIAETLGHLDAGRLEDATATLLGDQDDWARSPPATLAERRALLADADRVSFREAMDRLAFGPVATYFAHRWSDPTFLSGLALAEAHWTRPARIFELACGAGHYLREFSRMGAVVTGADVVWAKLWLARRFVAPEATLLCFDAAHPWPLADGAADAVFCHDAFYFLPKKPHVAAEMRRVSTGPVLVGHAHNALIDNYSSGAPLAPAGYAALFDDPLLYDDAELTRALVETRAPIPADSAALAGCAAVSLAAGAGHPKPVIGGVAMPPPGAAVRRNPLYVDGAIAWPSPRYEAEYSALATYPATLGPEPTGSDAWIRRRVTVDLPERW